MGVASAREILQRHPKLKVAIIEKEEKLAVHQSGHNSGNFPSLLILIGTLIHLPFTSIPRCHPRGHLLQAGLSEGQTMRGGTALELQIPGREEDSVQEVRKIDCGHERPGSGPTHGPLRPRHEE